MDLHVNFNLDVNDKQNRVEFDEPQECALTDATHVSISGPVTVNGVACKHHTHLFRTESGEWKTRCEINGETNHTRFHDTSLRKQDWQAGDPSFNAREKGYTNIPVLLSRALSELPDIEEKRLLAHVQDMHHKHERAKSAADEMRKELQKLDDQRANLAVALADAQNGECPTHYIETVE